MARRKSFFTFNIYLQTGNPRAGTAVEWGFKRFGRRAQISQYVNKRKSKALKLFANMTLRINIIKYRYVARNCIEVQCTTSFPVTFAQLQTQILKEIPGPFITFMKEKYDTVAF